MAGTALVTGASTGIGRATALRLQGAGWRVLAGVRDQEAGERLVAQARGPGELEPIELDVTDPDDVARAASRLGAPASSTAGGDGIADASHGPGRLDALVNNAGIAVGGPVELIDEEQLRRQFDVNVFGQIALTRALLPALRSARGRIAFISSIGGRVAMAFTAPYAASKHAIEAFGDALRVELATSGVQVTLIEPGSVATPIWDKGREQAETLSVPAELHAQYGGVPKAMDKVLRDTAERGVPPEEVAATIERALAARRMRARYVVGRDARVMLAAKRLLPDHTFDRFVRRAMGL